MKYFSLYFLACLLALHSTKTLAEETEEYKPIPELNYTAPKNSGASFFDDIRIHAGAVFINSYQDVPIGHGKRVQGGMRGAQFNFGTDLFSPNWILQGALFSLPQSVLDGAQISSNGFELRLIVEGSIFESVTAHGGLGIESRNYTIKSSIGDNSMSSGAWVLATGIDYWPAPFISAGVEISDHPPISNGDEPTSLDLGVRVNGHF